MNGINSNNNLLAILGGQFDASQSSFGAANSEEFLNLLQNASKNDPNVIDEFMAKALKSDPEAREAFAKALGEGDAELAKEFAARQQKVLAENPQLNSNIQKRVVAQKMNSVQAQALAENEVIENNPRILLDLKSGKGQTKINNGTLQLGGKSVQANSSDFVSQLNTTTSPELLQASQKNADVLAFETRVKNANQLLNKVKGYGHNQDVAKKSMFDINPASFNSQISMTDDLGNSSQVEAASGGNSDSSFDFMSSSMKSAGLDSFEVISPNTKVVDLSNIQASNKSELIQKITNYIEMSKLENSENLDVLVKHDELGNFRVNARKAGPGNQVDLQIQAATKEGQIFFAENEVEILKNLDKSGVKLSQFKLVTANTKSEMMSFSSDSKNSGSNFGESSNGQGQSSNTFGRGDSTEQRDSQRRKQLWEQYKEQSQAFA